MDTKAKLLAMLPPDRRVELARALDVHCPGTEDDPFFLILAEILRHESETEKARTAGVNAVRADIKPIGAKLEEIGKALFTTGFIRRAILGRLALWLAMTVTTVVLTLYGIRYLATKQLEELAPYTRNAETNYSKPPVNSWRWLRKLKRVFKPAAWLKPAVAPSNSPTRWTDWEAVC